MIKLSERQIIDLLISKFGKSDPNFGKDDLVYLHSQFSETLESIVLKSDMLVGSTDVPCAMKPLQIARKSIVSTVSDLVSKGVKPYALLLSLGLPPDVDDVFVKDLIDGFELATKEFDLRLLGGDTNQCNDLVIDCTIIGFTKKHTHLPKRYGANLGDVLVVSGYFGYPPVGLLLLNDNELVIENPEFKEIAINSVLNPVPKVKFGLYLSSFFSSSIDSSDGLSISLYELIDEKNNVDIIIENCPTTNDIVSFSIKNGYDYKKFVFFGGEEYEIVCSIPKNQFELFHKKCSEYNIPYVKIGYVVRGNGNVLFKEFDKYCYIEKKGYEHFK